MIILTRTRGYVSLSLSLSLSNLNSKLTKFKLLNLSQRDIILLYKEIFIETVS